MDDAADAAHAADAADASVAERIRRFRLSWHAGDLWPGVTEADFLAATGELARITGIVGLDRDASATVPAHADPRVLGIAAHVSAMAPLVGYWIEQGRLSAPPGVSALFARHLDHGRRRAARLRPELERVLGAFAGAGITPTVLKGMYTAWHYYPEPGTRPMADFDLLIAPNEMPAARAALTSLGLAEVQTNQGRSTWRLPGPSVPRSLEMAHPDDPWDVDLHVTLDRFLSDVVPAQLGPAAPTELIEYRVGRYAVRALGQPLLTAHLAIHLSDHFEMTSLMRIYELATVVRRDVAAGVLTWDALRYRLRAAGATGYVYPGFALAENLFPGTVDGGFLEAVRRETRRAVRQVVDQTAPGRAMRMFDRSAQIRVMWLGGWRAWVRWVWWRLWPRIGDAPAAPAAAARITLARLRRIVTGRMRWRRAG